MKPAAHIGLAVKRRYRQPRLSAAREFLTPAVLVIEPGDHVQRQRVV